MKNLLFILSLFLFAVSINASNKNYDEASSVSCMDLAIAYANAELANGNITHAEWFGVVNHMLGLCNEEILP